MLETILESVLKGSPWAMGAILGWVIYKKDQRIDEMHRQFGVQLDALHEKRLTDSKGREDKYQTAANGLKDNLNAVDTRLQLIDAKLPGSGGRQ